MKSQLKHIAAESFVLRLETFQPQIARVTQGKV